MVVTYLYVSNIIIFCPEARKGKLELFTSVLCYHKNALTALIKANFAPNYIRILKLHDEMLHLNIKEKT
jgi:hypothetical protein